MADEPTAAAPRTKTKKRLVPSYKTEFSTLQAEYSDLRSKVNMAVVLLKKAAAMDPAAAKTIMDAAVETLEGG